MSKGLRISGFVVALVLLCMCAAGAEEISEAGAAAWEEEIVLSDGTRSQNGLATTIAQGTCGENLTWVYDSDGTLTVSGTGDMDDCPEAIGGSCVQPWLEYKSGIRRVVIESGVTGIGYGAFQKCVQLTDVSLPDTLVDIGALAFDGCTSLPAVAIPDSVTHIGMNAFSRCEALTEVTLPKGLAGMEGGTFRGCTSLASVTLPDNITYIDFSAFSDCSALASVTLPDNITYIGSSAFSGCTSLASVTLPESVSHIGNNAFEDCTALTEIVIPDSVEVIQAEMFRNCANLAHVTLPSKLTCINEIAFAYCTALVSIRIPDTVTSIGQYVFNGCTSLKSIRIPSSVTSIGNMAFYNCTALAEAVFWADASVEISIDPEAFSKTTATICGCAGGSAYSFAKQYGYKFDTIDVASHYLIMPAETRIVSAEAFAGNGAVESVKINSGCTEIGARAFADCKNLKLIDIPASVTRIADDALENCSANLVIQAESTDSRAYTFAKEKGITVTVAE